ncbi:MAG: hypothetical protein GC178_09205 [Flavobacteriales bacterium]|nr:hypothetical protein [Flavobacteriales bacterium]
MRSYLLFIVFLTITKYGFSQDTIQESYDDVNDLKEKLVRDEIVELDYVNYDLSYGVKVPKWLNLKETGDDKLFGGTLPPVDGIKNAILISGFLRDEFPSFKEFEDKYLTGNRFGQPTKFSSSHIWYGQNPLVPIENGVKQRVFTIWNNHVYHNQFVLLQTKTAYLWIQFTATPETYEKNIGKFEEFLAGLRLLE